MAAHHHVTALQALVRDGYECCLSGLYDYEPARDWLTVEAMHRPNMPIRNAVTSFRRVHFRVWTKEKIRHSGLVLFQGPNTDFPTEGPRC